MTPESRIFGGLYGSLVGDALGVPVEFKPRADRVLDPVTDMRDYGTHGQPKGTWSDDGALLLCSVESLVEKGGFDSQDMGQKYLRWSTYGLWAAHGVLFDIGFATRAALRRIEEGCPAEIAGGTDEHSNGNGSLMRILPMPLASLNENDDVLEDRIFRASAITHAHDRSKLACVMHGLVTRFLMQGQGAGAAVRQAQGIFTQRYAAHPEFPAFRQVLDPLLSRAPEHEIGSDGYVMDTLAASLWCLLTTSDFSECVLKAVNLGDDTDTTGCVAGGLAGVLYGLEAIPSEWISALPRQDDLRGLFDRFLKFTGTSS
ncbi:MAG: ADP-ribosylglycohydrolase family protein [Verrucomicrobiaceae bacterium]|nr:MAG: ADP-ribosylglycohydrolase family protein [Verrucomicrobiaceae bacterium]